MFIMREKNIYKGKEKEIKYKETVVGKNPGKDSLPPTNICRSKFCHQTAMRSWFDDKFVCSSILPLVEPLNGYSLIKCQMCYTGKEAY